jgi:outer membrane protein insertion porin family
MYPATGSTDITVALTPGPRSVFGTVSVLGESAPLSEEGQAKIKSLTGQPFSEVRLENVRKEVKGDLQSRGWFGADVTASAPRAAESGGAIPAFLTISPGLPYNITEVRTVPGLSRGARRVANAVFQPAAGDRYDPETLDLLHRRALDTGIFSRLDVDPLMLGPDTMALSIEGEEAKPKTLGFFGGYETFFGPIAGIEARHVNFMDTGDSVGLRAEIRGTGANGSLQWTDPAIFGSRNVLSAGLALESFTFKDYYRVSLGLRTSLTRRFNRHITTEVFSNISVNAVGSDILTEAELGPEEYGTLTAGGRLVLDYRDNPLNTRKGWLAGLAVEGGFDQGGEEDINFVRTDFNASWYHPLGASWRLALGARASSLQSSGSVESVPIDLRLFNGGGTSVRSFAEREMGLKSAEGDTPLGGLATTIFNAELSYTIIQNLEVAAFADAGSVNRDDASIFSAEDLRYAVGMGIRYQLPIGPLRVDYGINPNPKEGEAFGALHVTFGFAF